MRSLKSKFRSHTNASHRRRTIKKTENKLINRRLMPFLQSIDEEANLSR
jgi:hypothetical protein